MSAKANEDPRSRSELLEEVEQLRIRLDKAEQALAAIHSGDMDTRKQTEEETFRANALVDTLLRTAPVGLCFLDRELRFIRINDQLAELNGIPAAAHLGRSVSDIVPSFAEAFKGVTRRILETGEPVKDLELVGETIAAPGITRYMNESWYPVRDEAEEIVGFGVVVEEITERKQTEEALRESEERLWLAWQATRDVIWDWDVERDSQRWSSAGEEVFGWTDAVEAPQTAAWWVERVHPDDRCRVTEGFHSVLDDISRNDWQDEYRFLRRDGSIAHVLDRGFISRDESGKPRRMVGAMQDITERKQAEEALRQSETRYRMLHESLRDPFVQVGMDGRIIEFNDLYCHMLGYSPEEMRELTYQELTPESWHPLEARIVQEQIIARGYSDVYEKEYRRKDGTIFPVELRTILARDAAGRPSGMWAIVRDITDRKKAEEALKALNDELEGRVVQRTTELREKDQLLLLQSRQAAMGEMIGNIAHQWRQPLNNLGLMIQHLLLLYDCNEFSREVLDINVSKSMKIIAQMSKTIDDFRNYFRPDKEKVEFKLSEAVTDTLSLLADGFKNHLITVEVAAKNDPAIRGFRNEFAHALLNILNNAKDVLLERQTRDPRVMITIDSEGSCAVLTVADNAGGISEEILGKVFEPYFTTKGPQQGTGVGLFMSKTIIEKNMGGRLTVRNTADGAEFRIEL